MFVGCYEISISIIIKQMQNVGIITAFCLFWGDFSSFAVPGGERKLLGSGLLGGISTQANTMHSYFTNSLVIQDN